jgi:hypothetical protein
VNTYKAEFFSACPNNGARVKYQLTIQTLEVLMVEAINDALWLLDKGFHEEIADQLYREFGGLQTLTADHHGVTIETLRASREPSNVRANRANDGATGA